jgi:serine/threonine protein kinase
MKTEEKCTATRVMQYDILETIGEGTFGEVKKCMNTNTKEIFAIKIVNWKKIRKNNLEEQMGREISALRNLNHPRVLKAIDVIRNNKFVYIVCELMHRGDMFDYVISKGRLNEKEALFYFKQLIDGVSYCHANNVCHRDLKLENLLIDEKGDLKIADFGYSQTFLTADNLEEIYLKTTCGTANYIAPEILRYEEYSGPQVDVWACGVILYAMTSGDLPFSADTDRELFKKISSGYFEMPNHFSKNLKDLLWGTLRVRGEERLTIKDIKTHPWFTSD